MAIIRPMFGPLIITSTPLHLIGILKASTLRPRTTMEKLSLRMVIIQSMRCIRPSKANGVLSNTVRGSMSSEQANGFKSQVQTVQLKMTCHTTRMLIQFGTVGEKQIAVKIKAIVMGADKIDGGVLLLKLKGLVGDIT